MENHHGAAAQNVKDAGSKRSNKPKYTSWARAVVMPKSSHRGIPVFKKKTVVSHRHHKL